MKREQSRDITHFSNVENQHPISKPTIEGAFLLSTSSNEGDQSNSSMILYQSDSDTISYKKPKEEEHPKREELQTSSQPQQNRRKPVQY